MTTSTGTAALSIESYERLLAVAPANDRTGNDPWPDDLTLVRQIACSMARRLPPHLELAELIALGNLGLVEARSRYDAARGVPFAAFAAPRIRGAILDSLRQEDLISRDERARVRRDENAVPSARKVELGDELALENEAEPADDQLARRRALRAMREAVGKLTPREQDVIARHYFDEQPLKAIGEQLGVSESRVCQIAGAAVARLRHVMAAQGR